MVGGDAGFGLRELEAVEAKDRAEIFVGLEAGVGAGVQPSLRDFRATEPDPQR